jgi:hypothetical protein
MSLATVSDKFSSCLPKLQVFYVARYCCSQIRYAIDSVSPIYALFGKWSTQHLYDFGFSRRFVLVRVWYLSSSEAYTNNWGLLGKENYLTFDWGKHFLKILRRSEVTINLTRRLKKMEASEFAPLYYYIVFFVFFPDAPSPCELNRTKGRN